jgi:hypothetical protein
MPVYIPSAFRPDDRLAKGVLSQFPENITPYLVVPQDEYDAYRAITEKHSLRCEILAHDVYGLPLTKKWIAEHAKSLGKNKFAMFDDDITILVRRGVDTWQLRAAEPVEVGQMIFWLRMNLEWYEYASISMREGNNRAGVGNSDDLVRFNQRSCRVHAYRVLDFLSYEHNRCPLHEDFDVNLQLLLSGGTMAVSHWWAQGQRMMNELGGCQKYRTHEAQEASVRKLAEIYPDYVRLRDVENKTDKDGMGTRVDATIDWKKAWSKGQEVSAKSDHYTEVSRLTGVPRPHVKTIILGRSYGLSDDDILNKTGYAMDKIADVLTTFGNLVSVG